MRSLYQFCRSICSTTVPSRLPAGDRYWRRATSATAVPMHHGNSCASGSLVVCPKFFGCAAAEGAERTSVSASRREGNALKMRGSRQQERCFPHRGKHRPPWSARKISLLHSASRLVATHASIEHSPADGGRDDLGGHVLCGRPAEQGRWHAWRAGWPRLSR